MAQAPKIQNLWESSWPNFNDVSNGSSPWDSGATKPGTLHENLEANLWSSLDADEPSCPSRHLDTQRSSLDRPDIISPYSVWNSDQIDKVITFGLRYRLQLWSPSANETNEWSLSCKKVWFDGISNATGPASLGESPGPISFAATDQVPENIIPENVFQSVWSPSTFCDSDLRSEKAVWGKLPIETTANNDSRSLSVGDDLTTLATSGSTETLNNDHATSPMVTSAPPATQSQSTPGHQSQEPRIPSPSSEAPLSHSQSVSIDNSNKSVAASSTSNGPDDLITQLINSHEGWGSRGVDQSTPWEETVAGHTSDSNNDAGYYANKSFASAKTEPTGLLQENNVWTNEPPTGTGIWELHYEQQGKKTARWQQNQEETRDLPLATGMPGTKLPMARPFDWRNSLVQAPNSGGSQPTLKPKMPNLRPLLGGTGAHVMDQSNNSNNDSRLLSAPEKDWSSTALCKAEQRSTSSQGVDSSSWFPRGLSANFGTDETDCLLPLSGMPAEGCWMSPSSQHQSGAGTSFSDQSTAAPSFCAGEQETGVGKLLSDSASGSIVHPCSHTYRADVVKHFMQLGYKKEDVQAVLIECNMDYERSLHQLRQHYIPIRAPVNRQPPLTQQPLSQFSLPRFPLTTSGNNSSSSSTTLSSPLEQPNTGTKESFFSDLDCHLQDDFSPFRQASGPFAAAAAGFPSGAGAPFMGAQQQPPGRMMGMPPNMSSARLAGLSAAAAAAAAFNSHLASQPSLPQVRRGLNQNNVAMKFMHSNGGNNSSSRSAALGSDVIQGPGGYPYSASLLGLPPDGQGPHGTVAPASVPPTLGMGPPPNTHLPNLNVASHHFRTARQWDLLNSIQELQKKQQEIIKQIQLYHSNPVMCSQPQYAAVFSELRAQLQHIESQLRAKEAHLKVMTAAVSNGPLPPGMPDGSAAGNGGCLSNDAMSAAGMAAVSSDLGGCGFGVGDLSRESSLAQKFLELRLRNAPPSPGSRSGPATRGSNGLRGVFPAAKASLHDGFLPDTTSTGIFAGRLSGPGVYGGGSGGGGGGGGGQWVIARPGGGGGGSGAQQAPTSLEALHLNLIQQPGLTYFHPDHQRRSALARYQSVEEAMEAARALSNRVAIALITDREAHAILQDISITA
ncbi:unnamed protein product [Schistocephalus solidus]|uniref:UBA domain-containing protein n=1 Tax=Schistocephalus solidus TaxID=70667 RepID=A0A183SIM8_SCHSO|nr:unnamed protein product [Schistocephalus solidus]